MWAARPRRRPKPASTCTTSRGIPVTTGSGGRRRGAAGGAKRLLSLGDQKTYSVQECLEENTDLQSHADVKVYYMNGNAQSVRIYSMENADGRDGGYSYTADRASTVSA